MLKPLCASLLSFLLFVSNITVFAQQKKTNPKMSSAPSAPKMDEGYTAKIKEFTTEKMFLTELVDHLPASDKVPTPEKVLGYVAGTPNKLTYTKDMNRYYRELEKSTPRVRVLVAPEKSEEGREQLLVLVSDEANLAKLDRYKEITAKLADPRKITDAEAETLISEGKPFYWASGSIHSPETGSPEMLMELAYRLAVSDMKFIEDIRKNSIVMITPTLEVDGRDRMVDLYNYRKANPGKPAPPLLFWGKYVAHDNNRDSNGMSLVLSRNQMRTFLDFHPQVLHDLHESVPFLYTSTGTGPYNPALDPLVIDEWHALAYKEIEEMTKRGVPGVWTHGFYDGWATNYMLFIANGHNSIGRFYETYGNSGADTQDRNVGAQSQRDWFRPNPPLPRVKWSMRNNTNMQQSGILFAMHEVAVGKERFLKNFYIKSKRAVAKAKNEGPAAYVISNATRPVEAADMVNLLRLTGVEVHMATKEFTVGGQKYPAGSYIVRMDQPYSRWADAMLDTQYYNVNDPRPYDDCGWTMGALRNVKTVRVTDKSVLDSQMSLITSDVKVSGKLEGTATAAYIINHNTDNTLMTLRYKLQDVKMNAAEDTFKVADKQFNAGSFIIKSEGNPSDLKQRLESAATELGFNAVAVDRVPDVKTHELAVPRIAILHTWTNTQNDGWFRMEFDRLKIPYKYISVHEIRDTQNLRDKYDVVIFPPVGGSAQSIVNGLPMRGDPIPWTKSDLTPNIGMSPDTTNDIRGGIELKGMVNLQKFIEDGGLFVPITSTASLTIDYGITTGISIQQSTQLRAQGSIFNASFADRKSPIAYGYDESLQIYFSSAPLFQVGGSGFVGGFGGGNLGGGQTGRVSGRGSMNDPDVVQAMPQVSQLTSRSEPGQQTQNIQATPPNMLPRVVLRFASDERNLLVSGMLAGGSELAGRPAVVDVPVGKGHVVFFATNPMWRHQTQGEFFLLFNAALNFNNLGAGRSETPRGNQPNANDDDNDN
jgi:hypothetical protein